MSKSRKCKPVRGAHKARTERYFDLAFAAVFLGDSEDCPLCKALGIHHQQGLFVDDLLTLQTRRGPAVEAGPLATTRCSEQRESNSADDI